MNQKLKVRIISLSAILVISVLLALLMNLTIEAARKGRTEERFVALIQETDDICGQTDQIVEEDEDWREENLWYKRSLVTFFEHMDKHPNTLAAIYNNDLVLLAKRNPIYMGYPLSLNDHPDLVNRLKTERL
ncbi:MAG: hypothetical protein LBD45_06130, partial [Bacteroidales bacterium]|nr:hypothetical protein [Bacteroidales bacterium]